MHQCMLCRKGRCPQSLNGKKSFEGKPMNALTMHTSSQQCYRQREYTNLSEKNDDFHIGITLIAKNVINKRRSWISKIHTAINISFRRYSFLEFMIPVTTYGHTLINSISWSCNDVVQLIWHSTRPWYICNATKEINHVNTRTCQIHCPSVYIWVTQASHYGGESGGLWLFRLFINGAVSASARTLPYY